MEKQRLELVVSDHFLPLFDISNRYLVVYGGRGSGKSEFIARKVIKRCAEEGGHRGLILRKVARDNDESTVAVVQSILDENEITYTFNKTKKIISFFSFDGKPNTLFFDGMDNRERIKSKKGITFIWCEEATELTADDFMQIDLILREPTPFYKQIILSFNPDEAQADWIKEMFFEDEFPRVGPGKRDDSYVHWSKIEHNPIEAVRNEYLKILDALDDDIYRKIYREGIWALVKGLIFPNWDVQDLPDMSFDEVFSVVILATA